jgi:hypothetical protein
VLIAPFLTPAPAPASSPVPSPCPLLQAKQFVASRREELLELQRSLLGFEEIAVREGLKPSEAEIEVSEPGEPASQVAVHGGGGGPACLRLLAGWRQALAPQAGRLQLRAYARYPCPTTASSPHPSLPSSSAYRPSFGRHLPSLGSTSRSTMWSGCGSRSLRRCRCAQQETPAHAPRQEGNLPAAWLPTMFLPSALLECPAVC